MRRGTTQNGAAEAMVRALTSGGVVARVNVRIDWMSGIAVGRVQTRGSWPTTTMKMRVGRAVLEWSVPKHRSIKYIIKRCEMNGGERRNE